MDIIERFFKKKFIISSNTKRSYRRSIEMFFASIGKDPETYFKGENDYEEDVSTFFESIQGLPSMSMKNRMNAVKQFLISNDRSIQELETWDTIKARMRGAEPISAETPLEAKDIARILQYADICGKAMFLIMSSSGMRMESLCGLLPDDIHDDETPCRIVLRPEIVKGKKQTITTFITPEAVGAYHSWLKVRDAWLQSAVKRTTMPKGGVKGAPRTIKDEKDTRVFPMSDVNVRMMWRNMLKKAGMDKRDKKTNRSLCRPHSCRKFFRSWLGNADLAETLLGHRGYLSTYKQYTYKALGQEYLKHMNNLNIFSIPADLSGIHSLMEEKDKKMKVMQQQIDEMDQQLRKLMIDSITEDRKKKKD